MKKLSIKKLTSLLVTLVMVLTIVAPFGTIAARAADAKTFDLVEITDLHGSIVTTSVPALPVAGVLAKDIKDLTATNPTRTLVMGGGDLYQGTPISNVLFGVPVQKAMSEIGMEVTALGNHEFDWTLDKIINTTMVNAKYSIVCSNLYNKTTGQRVFDPYKIITKDGLKIGIIGATTLDTFNGSVLAANIANYRGTDPATEINSLVSEVKAKGADIVIALIHEGSNSADTTNKTGPIFDIANKLVGVDAVFGGHSHTIVDAKAANGVPVYVANNAGKGYIDAKMTIGTDGKPSFVCDSTSYIAIDNNSPTGYKAATPAQDPAVQAIVDDANKQIGPTFNEIIGNDPTDLVRNYNGASESALGDWTAEVIRAKVGADIGIQNTGGIRTDVPKGDISVGTIFGLMPFDNVICSMNMTKAQLKYILEQAVMDNGKGIQISGVKVVYDTARPSMDRVTSITRANGTPISDTEILKVATNDFLMTGGDGFTGFVKAGGSVNNVPVNNSCILVRDALIENVRANHGINANQGNNLVNVGKVINIVGTSDLHGSLMPYDYSKMAPADLGLAKVSTYVNNLRAKNPGDVMLIDDGDTIQGTPLASYYDQIDTTSEYPMMKAMGAMHYDSWTLGNHEFNFGLDTLNRVMKDAAKENIPVLSANTYNTADNTNFVKPYIIRSFYVNGKVISVAILGLTTKCIPSWEDPAHYNGLKFNDLVDEAKKWVPILKGAGVDVIIVSAHSGVATPSDTIPENEVDAVATQVSGIDAILCGHTHTGKTYSFTNPDGKVVPVVEPKNTDSIFSEIDVNIDGNGKVGVVTGKDITLDASTAADPNIVAIGQPYQDKTLDYLNTTLGTATDAFPSTNQEFAPTALMDLINTIQMKAAGTQLSIAAPLSATANIPKGDVKLKDLYNTYVYENFLYGVKMTGKQIKNWMELSAKYYKQATNATDAPAKDPVLNIPLYNLDCLYGATYDIDLTAPVGSRIKNLKYQGKLIGDDDTFTVAINNYRFNGGGGFMAAAGLKPGDQSIVTYDSAKQLGDNGQIRSLMVQYIKDAKTITPTVSPSWKLSTAPVTQEQ